MIIDFAESLALTADKQKAELSAHGGHSRERKRHTHAHEHSALAIMSFDFVQ